MHIEEFQRVSISGEEKCGVRRRSLRHFLPSNSGKESFHSGFYSFLSFDTSTGAFHRLGGRCQVCGESVIHPGEVHKLFPAEFL